MLERFDFMSGVGARLEIIAKTWPDWGFGWRLCAIGALAGGWYRWLIYRGKGEWYVYRRRRRGGGIRRMLIIL